MSPAVQWLDSRFYAGIQDNWDDALFREVILRHIHSKSRVLDLGAGAGIVSHMNFRGLVSEMHGIDLDPRVAGNPFLDVAKVGDVASLPYSGETFDLVICDNVAEHLVAPDVVFREVCRVLKQKGVFLLKTPNSMHYMTLVARWTPLWFHRFYNRLRGRRGSDTFPTYYAANSAKRLRDLGINAGFTKVDVEHFESRPEYLRINAVTYVFGILYERIVNSVASLSRFRILLIARLEKDCGGRSETPHL